MDQYSQQQFSYDEEFREVDALLENELQSHVQDTIPESFFQSDISNFVTQFIDNIDANNEILNQEASNQEDEDEIDYEKDLEIRNYQYNLYEQGKNTNCIVYLSTGLGKTLVTIMLMWNKLNQFPDKKVVFLTNTIALCEQQAQQIRRQLPRVAELLGVDDYEIQQALELTNNRLKVLHGCKFPDHWSPQMWKTLFDKNIIFVMTVQLFVNLNRRGIVNFEEFSYVVFDECHAAQSVEHAYNIVMFELYFPLKKQLTSQGRVGEIPQIVGATASPVINKKTSTEREILYDLLVLAARLDAIYLNQDVDQIESYLNEAQVSYKFHKIPFESQEIQKILQESSYAYNLQQSSYLYDMLKNTNELPYYFKLREYIEQKQIQYDNNFSLKIILMQIQKQIITCGFKLYLEYGAYLIKYTLKYVLLKINQFIHFNPTFHSLIQLAELSQDLNSFYDKMVDEFKQKDLLTLVSHKSAELIRLLKGIQQDSVSNQDQKILIFIKVRTHAKYLNLFINEMFENTTFKSQFIIGHRAPCKRHVQNKGNIKYIEQFDDDDLMLTEHLLKQLHKDHSQFQSLNKEKEKIEKLLIFKTAINFDQQKEILANFRTDKLQILISTSVTEEGIDIPLCNYVICLNAIQSSKAFIQMKGRARKKNSQFIVFIPQQTNHDKQVTILQQIQPLTAQLIKKMVLKQSLDGFTQARNQLQEQHQSNIYYEIFKIQETGAYINTLSSCDLVYQFCYTLFNEMGRREGAKYAIYEIKKDVKQSQFQAFILLPYQVRGQILFAGVKQKSLRDAKASAAYKAAKYLYEMDYFDQNLKSVYANDIGYHIGADENDSYLEMTEEQCEIYQKNCLRVVNRLGFTIHISFKTFHQYYLQFFFTQTTRFTRHNTSFSLPFSRGNQQFQCIVSNLYLEPIQNCLSALKLLGFENTKVQSITNDQHYEYYQAYKTQTEKELNEKHPNISYRFATSLQIFLFADSDEIRIDSFTADFLLGLKIQSFKDLLKDKQEEWKLRQMEQKHPKQIYYHFIKLDKYWPTLLNTSEISNQTSEWDASTQLEILQDLDNQDEEELQDILDGVLLNSLQCEHNYGPELLVGQQYFRTILMLQMINDSVQHSQSFYIRNKKLRSSTFIRNQLLNVKLFQYLHFSNKRIQYFGVNLKTQKVPNNYQRISNHQFEQFLYKSCYLIKQHDNKMKLGMKWLDVLGITKYFKSILISTDYLRNLLPERIKDQEREQLVSAKRPIERCLQYTFEKPELLFNSLQLGTLQQFRKIYTMQKLSDKFAKQENNFQGDPSFDAGLYDKQQDVEEDELNFLMRQVDLKKYIDNTQLIYLGKQIWKLNIVQILAQQNLNFITHYSLFKQLTRDEVIVLITIQIEIYKYFVFEKNKLIIEKLIAKINYQKDINQQLQEISLNEATTVLIETFYAIYFAVFLDTNCDQDRMLKFTSFLLTKFNLQYMLSQRNLNSLSRFRFLTWYENNFKEPAQDFTLLKIPHLDYQLMFRGFHVYLPYDSYKACPINLLKNKLKSKSELQVTERSKQKAWDQLASVTCDREQQ